MSIKMAAIQYYGVCQDYYLDLNLMLAPHVKLQAAGLIQQQYLSYQHWFLYPKSLPILHKISCTNRNSSSGARCLLNVFKLILYLQLLCQSFINISFIQLEYCYISLTNRNGNQFRHSIAQLRTHNEVLGQFKIELSDISEQQTPFTVYSRLAQQSLAN